MQYIRSSGKNRVYEIDLEESFESSIVTLLSELMKIVYSNTVVLCRTKKAAPLALCLKTALEKRGFVALDFDPSKGHGLPDRVEHFCQSGIVVPFISQDRDFSDPDHWEREAAASMIRQNERAKSFPIYVKTMRCDEEFVSGQGAFVSAENFKEYAEVIVEEIVKLTMSA